MRAPADDEVEITIFGRGMGECIVVHLLDGRWLIVDSFVRDRGQPVAEWYLRQLEVPTEAVEAIVVTHFHQDHYKGIGRLYHTYDHAQLFYTAAWGTEQYKKVLSSGARAGRVVEELAGALQHASERFVPGTSLARSEEVQVGTPVRSEPGRSVVAVSPTSAAKARASREIREALDRGPNAVRTRLRNDNRCSIALHLSLDGVHALLGADLENSPREYGWMAVLEDHRTPALPRVGFVKVPHHGSETAAHDGGWEHLTDGAPVAVVSPFTASRLPRVRDLRRLNELSPEIWVTSPTRDRPLAESPEEIEEGGTVHVAKPGFVRARRTVGADRWDVVPFEAAALWP